MRKQSGIYRSPSLKISQSKTFLHCALFFMPQPKPQMTEVYFPPDLLFYVNLVNKNCPYMKSLLWFQFIIVFTQMKGEVSPYFQS
jgi:hypothetical protein